MLFVVLMLICCVCVAESPLQFYVNHASSPNVTAYGPGLSYGVANKLATFTVFTEDASEGTLATGGGRAAVRAVTTTQCKTLRLPTLCSDFPTKKKKLGPIDV